MRWARNYNKCIECGTTEKKHHSHGLCSLCYHKDLWKRSPERRRTATILNMAWRDRHPEKWNEISRKAVRKYYKKNKAAIYARHKKRLAESPEYRAKCKKRRAIYWAKRYAKHKDEILRKQRERYATDEVFRERQLAIRRKNYRKNLLNKGSIK